MMRGHALRSSSEHAAGPNTEMVLCSKAWAMQTRQAPRDPKKAISGPCARRLAVIMHRIWVDGTEFRLD